MEHFINSSVSGTNVSAKPFFPKKKNQLSKEEIYFYYITSPSTPSSVLLNRTIRLYSDEEITNIEKKFEQLIAN